MPPFHLDQILPWGRSFDEYLDMFALTPADLASRILALADGPASFNAHLTRRNGRVLSADPLYDFTADQIETRIAAARPLILSQAAANADRLLWGDRFPDLAALDAARSSAMADFLSDFRSPSAPTRYLATALPDLDHPALQPDSFDLALCSHFLFLYDTHLSLDFHIASIRRVLALAPQFRIFPLLNLEARPSALLDPVRTALHQSGHTTDLHTVPYEFQRGGNQMLIVSRPRRDEPRP